MGREAQCVCRWGDREGRVTALLESSELIVRGAIRGRAALHTIEAVNARDDVLEFVVAGERIELQLGAAVSRRWARVRTEHSMRRFWLRVAVPSRTWSSEPAT